MEEEIIKEVDSILNSIFEKAKTQLDDLKQKQNSQIQTVFSGCKKYVKLDGILMPYETGLAKTMINPDTFLYFTMEIFWKFYDSISKNIRNPLIQFSMRPLLELCYGRIIYFVLQNPETQKDIATKFWLCTQGLISHNGSDQEAIYTNLILELSKVKDQEYFKGIQKKGFPQDEIFKKKVFPTFSDKDLLKQVEPYLIEIWGKTLNKEYLFNVYQWLCQYMHANVIILQNLEREQRDKTHILRCTVILFLTGYHLLVFTDQKLLALGENMSDIKDNISKILLKLKSK